MEKDTIIIEGEDLNLAIVSDANPAHGDFLQWYMVPGGEVRAGIERNCFELRSRLREALERLEKDAERDKSK